MSRLHLIVALLFPAAFGLSVVGASPSALLAAATALTVAVAALVLITRPSDDSTAPAGVRAIALRERAHRTAFLRLRDPDAAGRPRPRAPGRGYSAA
ncbi:hypothetical protein F0L68_17975 [Solihabitans fulvus]|uniref:Uncharacterized protein n=1 Tax=Solihabitans fulvus TaxID=1892852 RepID=A0A5B2XEF9_9PSEU|nr:DUF6412 domain-containing protein [Solihabitans fulvus]KAA2261330.1 hypothetical protein F0L68_17975 [Solihabitans fulvus]